MAQSTVELRNLLTTNFKLFDFDYVFDDPVFKAKMEQYITDFYYDYEIGFETPDMFKRKFKARWKRIIPYYNQLYNTTLLAYNPLKNYSVSEALDQLSTTESITDAVTDNISESITDTTGNSHTVASSDNTDSDYPQQPIAGGDYLKGASSTDNESTTNDDGNVTNNTTGNVTGNVTGNTTTNNDYTKTIEGITGTTYPELIQKHRDALLRVQDMVIEEMKCCFILVY